MPLVSPSAKQDGTCEASSLAAAPDAALAHVSSTAPGDALARVRGTEAAEVYILKRLSA